jgi:hypothetical protein
MKRESTHTTALFGQRQPGVQLDAVETAIARMAHAGLSIDEYYRPDE